LTADLGIVDAVAADALLSSARAYKNVRALTTPRVRAAKGCAARSCGLVKSRSEAALARTKAKLLFHADTPKCVAACAHAST
jgi:hypothetical protein